MSENNYYEVLEVSPKASAEVVRAAYKSLMQRYHPDKNPGPQAAQRAALIVQAYEVLGDPDKRAAYDASISEPAPSQPRAGQGATAAGRVFARASRTQAPSKWQAWYVWVLIVVISGGGWLIHVRSKNSAALRAAPAAAQATVAAVTVTELQVRTMPAFVTDFSVDLMPSDPARGNPPRILLIPEVVLRVEAEEPERWLRKLEEQRSELSQLLLRVLSRASYDELGKAEGDLYLRSLIENTVSAAIGMDAYAAQLAPAAAPMPPRQVLRAYLPQLYSVR